MRIHREICKSRERIVGRGGGKKKNISRKTGVHPFMINAGSCPGGGNVF